MARIDVNIQRLADHHAAFAMFALEEQANPLALCRVLLSARTDLDPITRATLRALCGLRFAPDPLAPIRPDFPGVSDVLEPPASGELPGGRRP